MTTRDLPVEIAGKSPRSALRLPGTSGNYVSAPYVAAMGITGDIDIRWVGAMDDWSPAAYQVLVGRLVATGDQRCWMLTVGAAAKLYLYWSTDGATLTTLYSSVAPTVSDGQVLGIRVILDVDNGAGNSAATFYTSTDEGATWTQLGTVATAAGTSSIFNSTSAPLTVGTYSPGTASLLAGTTLKAEVRDGIAGTVVASFDATAPMGPRYRDPQGNIWTINGSAWTWSRT